MEGTKGQIGSITIWGLIVTAVSYFANKYGYTITTAMQLELTEDLIDIVSQVAGIVGGVMAWWGRIRATKRIGQ